MLGKKLFDDDNCLSLLMVVCQHHNEFQSVSTSSYNTVIKN